MPYLGYFSMAITISANFRLFKTPDSGKAPSFNYLLYMNKKITLDLANQAYYFKITSAAHAPIFSSVFAIDYFLQLVNKQATVSLYGYCFFPDSLHILLHSETLPSQWLENCLVQYNQWHKDVSGDSGYLFDDDQTQQVLVQPKNLLKALYHVHNMPVSLNLFSTSDQYPHSSYHDYTREQSTQVATNLILSMLSHHSGQREKRFQDYMASSFTNLIPPQLNNHEFYLAYADANYITRAMSNYSQTSELQDDDHYHLWQACLTTLQEVTQLDQNTLLGISRHHNLPEAHFLLAWLFVTVAKGPLYFAANRLATDQTTLQLKINSLSLHHPKAYLRYIANFWQQSTTV
jgi:hypothetical protein